MVALTARLKSCPSRPISSLSGAARSRALSKLDRRSINRMLGRIAVAGHDIDFLFFAFLVFHFQRTAIGRHDLDLQLAVGAIQLCVGGMIRERILVADVVGNIRKSSPTRLQTGGSRRGLRSWRRRFAFHYRPADNPCRSPECPCRGRCGSTPVSLAILAHDDTTLIGKMVTSFVSLTFFMI